MDTGTCGYGDGYRYLWLESPSGPEGLWSQGCARAGAAPACHIIASQPCISYELCYPKIYQHIIKGTVLQDLKGPKL